MQTRVLKQTYTFTHVFLDTIIPFLMKDLSLLRFGTYEVSKEVILSI